MKNSRKPIHAASHPGFALVVTLTLMVLLTILAVGLLTLSTVTLRSTGQGDAASIARSNARLGMMLALGELQATMGKDQSVSAPAGAVFTGAQQPHLTGVWDSWRWQPTNTGSPNYGDKAAKFRSWLVSAANPTATQGISGFSFPASAPAGETVSLVGSDEPGKELEDSSQISTHVAAEKVTIRKTNSSGNYAWAVFDDSTKADINLGDPTQIPSGTLEAATRTAPSRFRADIAADKLESVLSQPKNLISLETAVIPGGSATQDEVRMRVHDFTTGTVGLLTDTGRGGLKRDLTALFESSSFPQAAFANTPTTSQTTPYPPTMTTSTGAPQWRFLYDHYRKYKAVTSAAGGAPSYSPSATDLAVVSNGLNPTPIAEKLLPVIAKFQMVFSIVAHHTHISPRPAWLDANGDPKGNTRHAVPHLAYDPVITLYNPYDVTLNMAKLRVRVWNPPVGFKFTKIAGGVNAPYRTDGEFVSNGGGFHSLATFDIATEGTPTAKKCFTLVLTDGTEAAAGNSLKLLPGEVKVFSARVEKDWNWALETSNGNKRSFFDYDNASNFSNVDKRTSNDYGVEAVPGWDTRAGLQTDHLSYGGRRPLNTLYPFEATQNKGAGWICIRLTDRVKVEARPMRTGNSDFKVDLMAGRVVGTNANTDTDATHVDMLRSYKFTITDFPGELSEDPANPVLETSDSILNLMQYPADKNPGGKKPFAMLEFSARTTKDDLTDSKSWLFNNPVVEGGTQVSTTVGLANQSYDIRFRRFTSFNAVPGIEIDGNTNRGFFGSSSSSGLGGSSFVTMFHVPVAPAASLGDLIPSNLVTGSNLPRVVHAFGNSRAHPLLSSDKVFRQLGGANMFDHSYLLNDALWDSYFFSSLTAYPSSIGSRTRNEVIEDMLSGVKPALNTRLTPVVNAGDPEALADEIDGLTDAGAFSSKVASYVGVKGPFNLNSTSVDAWIAVLSSLRDRDVTGWSNGVQKNKDSTPFVRAGLPYSGSIDSSSAASTAAARWAGYRALSDGDIKTLARKIVDEIRKAGVADKAPPLTLAEFVNRRIGSSTGLHNLSGLLQTAIEESGINDSHLKYDSKTNPIQGSLVSAARSRGVLNTKAMDGYTADGAPSVLTQGDLMGALAPIATVRGDTFKIRSYGEALASDGVTVTARAWCETTVQRVPEFVDPSDGPEVTVAALNPTNLLFGRRFQIVSFRWLSPEEI